MPTPITYNEFSGPAEDCFSGYLGYRVYDPQGWRRKTLSDETFQIELPPLKVILADQTRIHVQGLKFEASVIDKPQFELKARSTELASITGKTILNQWLRISLGNVTPKEFIDFDLWKSVQNNKRALSRFEYMGLEIASLSLDAERFYIYSNPCIR